MIEIRCKGQDCDRFLKVEPVGTFIGKVTCPDRKCKHVNQIKIVTPDSSPQDLRYKFGKEATNE